MKYLLLLIPVLFFGNCSIFCPPSDPCKNCNDLISNQAVRMILFDRDTLCGEMKLLNPPLPILDQKGDVKYPVNYSPSTLKVAFERALEISENCTSPVKNSIELVGYYLQPELSLIATNNRMKFRPIWLHNYEGTTTQLVGPAILVGPQYLSELSTEMPMIQNSTYPKGTYVLATRTSGTFNHNVLQFHATIDKFDKTYVSLYELKMILENGDYLGISGARVSTGNIGASSWGSDPEAVPYNSGNEDLFTYRLTSFRQLEFTVPDSTGSINNTYKRLTQSSNLTDPLIPTTTWATPCPPMWKNE